MGETSGSWLTQSYNSFRAAGEAARFFVFLHCDLHSVLIYCKMSFGSC